MVQFQEHLGTYDPFYPNSNLITKVVKFSVHIYNTLYILSKLEYEYIWNKMAPLPGKRLNL